MKSQKEREGRKEGMNEYQFLAELNGSFLIATFPALTTPTKHTNPSELGGLAPHFILNLHRFWVSLENLYWFVGHKSKGVSSEKTSKESICSCSLSVCSPNLYQMSQNNTKNMKGYTLFSLAHSPSFLPLSQCVLMRIYKPPRT